MGSDSLFMDNYQKKVKFKKRMKHLMRYNDEKKKLRKVIYFYDKNV